MPGPPPAVAAVRVAVRQALTGGPLRAERVPPRPGPQPGAPLLLVACSGGADSLALAAGTAFVAPRLGWAAGAVVVDHGLQAGSAEVAEAAAARCRDLGLDPVEVVRVVVGASGAGPEGDARRARYAALASCADRVGARAVLLGHTLDDQAEQVLLGLVRGSGARSLAGMRTHRVVRGGAGDGAPHMLLVRPLLGVSRAQTAQACAELGLEPWQDPHNEDHRFTRVRARRGLADLERDLGPGVVAGLARTASLLQDDADALDTTAGTAYLALGPPPWAVTDLRQHPRAVRTRLWRRLALDAGSPGTDLTSDHLLAVDGLVTAWRGQGPLHLPGGVRASRTGERVAVRGPRS
ncbi:tRNA lysidine(34) synthetase TilS [Ornithinimicrobium pekingense]|uniref:tRNA(Ile)-lysidine synthase n=1 Tax=Ornithinimicrobium pekingense TaxID=384677 RepID=A0ABQ2F3L8_9MICO|nr:tRNA lysidine(34) synthetase TilS [Ornithinimicrobium pekingense]GGK57962.1 tRNA(Ile)-lysidine synthase [Ornithinimicrobium pekingense]